MQTFKSTFRIRPWMRALIAQISAASIALSALAASPEQVAAAKADIAQIQSIFVQEVQAVTGLTRPEVDKFMPGGAMYGREITEFHRLTPTQLDALRQADARKKRAITAAREKHGVSAETARAGGSRF